MSSEPPYEKSNTLRKFLVALWGAFLAALIACVFSALAFALSIGIPDFFEGHFIKGLVHIITAAVFPGMVIMMVAFIPALLANFAGMLMLMSHAGQDRFVFLEGKAFLFAGSIYGWGILLFAVMLIPFNSLEIILTPPYCIGALVASALAGIINLKIARRIVERAERQDDDEQS